MNKLFKSIVAASLGVAMAIGVGAGLGREAKVLLADDATYTIGWGTASGNNSTNFAAVFGSVNGVLSFEAKKNSSANAPAYNSNASELRLYYNNQGNGGSILITPADGVTFTAFSMTTSTSPTVKYAVDDGAMTAVSGSDNVYSATNFSASASLEIQNANTANTQLRIKTIEITYSVSGEIPVTYSVTYNPNGGTGTLTDSKSPYKTGSTVTVLSNTFTWAGHEFSHWNTELDDSGDSYDAGDTFTIDDDVELFAQWEENQNGIIITPASSNFPTGGYASGAERTWTQDGIDFGAKAVYLSGGNIQCQASNARIYNISAFGGVLASVTLTQTGSSAWSLYGGSSSRLVNDTAANYTVTGGSTAGITAPATDTTMKWTIADSQNYTYFCLSKGSSAGYVTSIVIELRESLPFATINGDDNVEVGTQWTPTSITANEGGATITGATFAFTPSNGAVISSSNENTGAFTASAAGTVTVSATKTGYAIADKIVTVNPLPVAAESVTIGNHSASLVVGQEETISATLEPQDATDNIVWNSSNTSVATIDEDGKITALAIGSTTISATAGLVTDEYILQVEAINASNVYNHATIDLVGEVIATHNKEAMIDDGTAGLWTYSDANVSVTKGQIVRVTGQATSYNGALEISGAQLTELQSGEVTKCSAQPITTEKMAEYRDAYVNSSTPTLPHKKVSLTTDEVTESNGFFMWHYGDTLMETHMTSLNMEAGFKYEIEGYLSKYYVKNSDVYVCIVLSSATKVEEAVDSPDEYMTEATTFASVYASESGTVSRELVLANCNYENADPVTNLEFNDSTVSIVCNKGTGTNDPKYYDTGAGVRIYHNNTVTFSSSDANTKIIKIEFTYASGGATSGFTASVGKIVGRIWAGNSNSVTLTNGNSDHYRISSIIVTYCEDEQAYSLGSVGMRFGVSIAEAKWKAINNDNRWEITDYGVMMVKQSTLTTYGETSVENAYRHDKNVTISNKLKNSDYDDPYLLGGVYSFTVKLSGVPSTEYNTVVCAAPYIVVKDEENHEEYYFFDEISYSVEDLADYCYNNGGSSLSGKALSILSGN